MTRDDILWLATRVVSLYFAVDAVGAAPAAIASFVDTGMSEAERLHAKVRAIAPLVAALALFEFTRRRSGDAGTSEVSISMHRDDLLWVCCKALGLFLMVLAIDSAATLVTLLVSGAALGVDLMPILLGVLLRGALGGWLFFGQRLWRMGASDPSVVDQSTR